MDCSNPSGEIIESPVRMVTADCGTHLRFRLTGHWSVDPILLLAQTMAQGISASANGRALIDLLDMEGVLSMEERYRMGAHLGSIFAHAKKVAVVQVIRDQNGYVAKIANRAGAKIQVFSHEDDALIWLLH